MGGAGGVDELDGDPGVPVERAAQDRSGHQELAEPADEVTFTGLARGGHAAAAVDRGLDAERGAGAGVEGGVARLAALAGQGEGGGELAVVDVTRHQAGVVLHEGVHGQAVVGACAEGDQFVALHRDGRARAQRAQRLGDHPPFEGGKALFGDQGDHPDVAELGVALHRPHRFDPAVEFGRARMRVAGDEGAGVDHQVFLVLDRELERRGDLGGVQVEGEPGFVGVRLSHALRPHHRGDAPADRNQGRRRDPGRVASMRESAQAPAQTCASGRAPRPRPGGVLFCWRVARGHWFMLPRGGPGRCAGPSLIPARIGHPY